MINGIGNGTFAGAQYYTNVTNKSGGGATALAEQNSRNDAVSISDSYRAFKSTNTIALPEPVQPQITEADTLQNVIGSGTLGKYTNIGLGAGETNLTAMNFSRKQIGGKVDSILKAAGIKLGKDERVAMSIGADNKIKVSGIKDKKKAAKIEEALNEDKSLGKEMRTHAATGRITQNAKKQQDYVDWMNQNGQAIPEDLDELFTHSGIRAFVLDEYLKEEAGVGISDLSLVTDENGTESFANMSDPLAALFSDDPSLENTLKRMVREGKTDTTFSASFEFANGAISDPASLEMAKSKLEDIKARVMGGIDKATDEEILGEVDKVLDTMDQVGVSIDDEELRSALERGFTIRFDNTGKFEVVSEDMSADTKLFLERLVQKAMDNWAESGKEERYVLEGLGGDRVANLADVADAFIEEHRFEHGDVDEHKHQVEFHFGGSVNQAKVVSEEADRAQDEKNKELSAELGSALRDMLGENDIDASNMTMEIDQNGKITVQGDPKDPELQKAQSLIDSFLKDAKASGTGPAESGVTSSRENLPANERRNMLFGDEEEEYTPEGWARRDVMVDSDTPEKVQETEEEARLRSYGLSQETRAAIAAENWKKVMPGLNPEATIHNGVAGSVSNINKPPYSPDEIISRTGNSNLASSDKAISLYRELMNGMQFHDGRRNVRYAM